MKKIILSSSCMSKQTVPLDNSVGAFRLVDAARYVGVGRTTFIEMVKQGKIPCNIVGKLKLYRKHDLDEFLRPKGAIEKLMQSLVEAIKKEYFHGRK